jgi:hypothetical protein
MGSFTDMGLACNGNRRAASRHAIDDLPLSD